MIRSIPGNMIVELKSELELMKSFAAPWELRFLTMLLIQIEIH